MSQADHDATAARAATPAGPGDDAELIRLCNSPWAAFFFWPACTAPSTLSALFGKIKSV